MAAFAQLSGAATLVRGLIDSCVGLRLEAVDGAYKLSYRGLGPELPVDLLDAKASLERIARDGVSIRCHCATIATD